MKFEYVYDFVITNEDGTENEVRLPAVFEAPDAGIAEASAAAFWHRLLQVLPAGRVGGGYYRAEEAPDIPEADDGPR